MQDRLKIDTLTAGKLAHPALDLVAESNAFDNEPLPGITVLGKPVTRKVLSAAFDLVANADNWKNPINTVVDLDDATLATIREAVIFFAGCVPTFTARVGAKLPRCRYHVRAAGYYATIGA